MSIRSKKPRKAGNCCSLNWINIQKKEALETVCFVWVCMCCLQKWSFHICLKSGGQEYRSSCIPEPLGYWEGSCALVPFWIMYLPQVLSLLMRYLFHLRQILALLSFLNSRAFKTGSWQQENASRTNDTQTQRDSVKKFNTPMYFVFQKTSATGCSNWHIVKNKDPKCSAPW